MERQYYEQSINRISEYFKLPEDVMHGFIITSNDKIFVSFDGRFVFQSKEHAQRVFYNDTRHLCWGEPVHEPSCTYNRRATTTEWNNIKKEMNIKIIKI